MHRININGRKDTTYFYFDIDFECILSYSKVLANLYVADKGADSTSKFPDAQGDHCEKLINAVELIDRKCQNCHSTS